MHMAFIVSLYVFLSNHLSAPPFLLILEPISQFYLDKK